MLIDIESEAVRLLEAHGFDPADPPSAEVLAAAVVGAANVVTRSMFARSRYIPARDAIEVRAGLSSYARQWALAHELAERILSRGCWSSEIVEQFADAIAGALLVPAPLFRAGLRACGRSLPRLSQAFGVSQSVVSLRLGEVTGSPLALVTRQRVHIRGDMWGWPAERDLRRLAIATVLPPEVERVVLTDSRHARVMLVAA